MQIHIIEVNSTLKSVNTYNMGSLFSDLKDNEPNRNSNQLN
jgi:hypothetical protein